jgi:hypothetical protein
MEKQLNYLAGIFEQVLDAYETTGRVPDQLIAQAQHGIMMARAPRSSKTFEEARGHAEHIVNTQDILEIESLRNQDQKRGDQFLEQVEAHRERQRGQRADLTQYFNDLAARRDREQDKDRGGHEH